MNTIESNYFLIEIFGIFLMIFLLFFYMKFTSNRIIKEINEIYDKTEKIEDKTDAMYELIERTKNKIKH